MVSDWVDGSLDAVVPCVEVRFLGAKVFLTAFEAFHKIAYEALQLLARQGVIEVAYILFEHFVVAAPEFALKAVRAAFRSCLEIILQFRKDCIFIRRQELVFKEEMQCRHGHLVKDEVSHGATRRLLNFEADLHPATQILFSELDFDGGHALLACFQCLG